MHVNQNVLHAAYAAELGGSVHGMAVVKSTCSNTTVNPVTNGG